MELLIIVISTWIISVIISIKLRHGWEYYYLYPKYPFLGSPNKLWNDSIDHKTTIFDNGILEWLFGPIGLFVSLIVYGIPTNFKMFKFSRTKIVDE